MVKSSFCFLFLLFENYRVISGHFQFETYYMVQNSKLKTSKSCYNNLQIFNTY